MLRIHTLYPSLSATRRARFGRPAKPFSAGQKQAQNGKAFTTENLGDTERTARGITPELEIHCRCLIIRTPNMSLSFSVFSVFSVVKAFPLRASEAVRD
jgi:hypothetical protein